MAKTHLSHRQRVMRLLVASLAFLVGSSILIIVVFRGYLVPAYEAWRYAGPREKSMLSASSTLLLAIVLVVLFLLLIAAFGVRRYFYHSHDPARSKTKYVDAWAESAQRMRTTDPNDPD